MTTNHSTIRRDSPLLHAKVGSRSSLEHLPSHIDDESGVYLVGQSFYIYEPECQDICHFSETRAGGTLMQKVFLSHRTHEYVQVDFWLAAASPNAPIEYKAYVITRAEAARVWGKANPGKRVQLNHIPYFPIHERSAI